PNSVNCLLTRAAPGVWRWPSKQCAKIAYALGGESGKSMVPSIRWPAADENVTFADCMIYRITGWVLVGLAFPTRVNRNHTYRFREMESHSWQHSIGFGRQCAHRPSVTIKNLSPLRPILQAW